MAIVMAQAAQGVEFIGLPEGRILLSQAVTYLACALKSNAAYMAIDAALNDVRTQGVIPVPNHLRDSHYPGATHWGMVQDTSTHTTRKRAGSIRTIWEWIAPIISQLIGDTNSNSNSDSKNFVADEGNQQVTALQRRLNEERQVIPVGNQG